MVVPEPHADSGVVPDQVRGMVAESEVERDRVELGVAPVGQRLGAQHDDAARVELPAGVSGHAVARHLRVRRAEQQDAAALGGHRRVLVLLAELVVVEDAVVPDDGVARAAALPVVEDQDALAVSVDDVAADQDVPGVPDEDAELVAERPVIPHHRVGMWRIPDVEPGLVVTDRGVVGEQGLRGDEAGDAVTAVVDRHHPGHLEADRSVAEHPVAGEAGDQQSGHRVVADGREDRAGLRVDALRQDAYSCRAEPSITQRLREVFRRDQHGPAVEGAGSAQGDSVLADLDALVVHAGSDEYRVAGSGRIDRGLNRVARAYYDHT